MPSFFFLIKPESVSFSYSYSSSIADFSESEMLSDSSSFTLVSTDICEQFGIIDNFLFTPFEISFSSNFYGRRGSSFETLLVYIV